ncbi:unnamed protein product [Linum tenue]|uniref:CBS domain-containing protein n=1 Tax=Linum tenue TaxID=586396 RepID=A0AAV0GXZ7_9ROSI|nr:unnamed protein product [Linum tenue]
MQEAKKMMEVPENHGIKNPDAPSAVDSNFITDLKQTQQLDSGAALQSFLDHIPISSIPGIQNSPVSEVKAGDTVKQALDILYRKNVFGAPIADSSDPENITDRASDRYMGFIDFARMLLWCLHKSEKLHAKPTTDFDSISTMLHKNPEIADTKVGELAKSFLWDPFFPVHPEDTLFHVLLLLCKHQLQAVPVVEESELQVIGFVTKSCCFHREEHLVTVYGDQSLTEALHLLWGTQIGVIAVVSRANEKVIGCIRNSDVYLLLENDDLFSNRKSITAEEFIHTERNENADCDPTIQRDLGALLSAGTLKLKNNFLPKMDSVVANKRSDTLKQEMMKLSETNSSFSFIVDQSMRPTGILLSRDVIVQFAPPGMDSSFQGEGFFEFALEQAGCQEKNGAVICDHQSSSSRLIKATTDSAS